MSSDLVTIDINNGIADVRLNREEKYNALSQDMFDAIIDAGQSLASADHVSAVVLSGNAEAFARDWIWQVLRRCLTARVSRNLAPPRC